MERTIEDKLDWILSKVKDTEGISIGTEEDTNLQRELYGINKENYDFQNDRRLMLEWMQLQHKLFDKDELLTENELNQWVLTLKGKQFIGYTATKKRELWRHRLNMTETWAVILGGIFAFLYYFYQLVPPIVSHLFHSIFSCK